MFSIGEFSRMCQVSAKTLRHYDSIGLLKPAYLNEANGYRFYEAGQMADMLFIMKLRYYGFPLEDIAAMADADDAVLLDRFRAMLDGKKDEQRRTEAVMRQIRNDIEKIEKGIDIMENNVDVKIVERQPLELVSVRGTIAIKDFSVLFNKLYAKIGQEGVQPSGPPMAIYYSQDFDPESTDVEVGFPTANSAAVNHTLAGGTCAMAIHKGSYSGLNKTYTALAKWIESNGKQITNAPFEIYLNDPGDVPGEQLMTEVYFPIG